MIPFDLVKGSSPLIIGMDINKFSNTSNMGNEKTIEFKRPQDTQKRKLITYIGQDRQGDERLWVEIAPHVQSTVVTIMANIKKRPELNIVKKVHRFMHGNSSELSRLFEEAGMLTPRIKRAISKVTESCTPCAKSGRPKNTKKLSLKHVNREFNDEVQADFMTIKHNDDKYEVLNISDCSTAFGERCIVKSRSAEVMMGKFEEMWICRHDCPVRLSADPEFCKPFFLKYLNGLGTEVNERPGRSSHKNGSVERNNGLFKFIFEKMSKEKTHAGAELILARASFAGNMMFGRSRLNAFQLVRGYLPRVAGMPQKILTSELMETYTKMSTYRAIQTAMTTRHPKLIPSSMLKEDDDILVFYKPTNKWLNVEWIKAKVTKVREHYVECRRSSRGPPYVSHTSIYG